MIHPSEDGERNIFLFRVCACVLYFTCQIWFKRNICRVSCNMWDSLQEWIKYIIYNNLYIYFIHVLNYSTIMDTLLIILLLSILESRRSYHFHVIVNITFHRDSVLCTLILSNFYIKGTRWEEEGVFLTNVWRWKHVWFSVLTIITHSINTFAIRLNETDRGGNRTRISTVKSAKRSIVLYRL